MRERLGQILARASGRAADTQRNDRLGALAGFATLAVLAAADIALGAEVNLIGTFIVVPFVAAVWAGIRVTALVGAATLIVAIASGTWNMNFGDTDYDARVVVLLAGGLLAVASAWARERARLAAQRLELLDEVGAIADGSLPLAQTLERVIEVIVPAFADFCMVDAIHDQRVMRSAVRVRGTADGRAGPPMERYLAEREPSMPEWMIQPRGAVPAPAAVHPPLQRRGHAALSHGADDLEWLRGLGLRSTITVAMLARGRMLGALTFTRRGRGVATHWMTSASPRHSRAGSRSPWTTPACSPTSRASSAGWTTSCRSSTRRW